MASPTYSTRGIVLRKTKLSESDLIISLLNQDGSLLKCVAKGARKPTSQFASRLELYSEVDLLCAKGRSLDIVKETRLIQSHDRIRCSLELSSAAGPMAELLSRVAQEGLENPVLFKASSVAYSALNEAELSAAPAICAAHLLKTLAYAGLRPSFEACVGCGCEIDENVESLRFSFSEGGVVCGECAAHCDSLLLAKDSIAWSRYFLLARFSEILELSPPVAVSLDALQLSQELIRAHVGSKLKSLEFLFTGGFFD
ncbi:MAG: DNA repair protein RecO [Eggerthellaceae bacterium]|nr:DNA repair protein RecO [Eggerthellaceae bacterium]